VEVLVDKSKQFW